MPVAFSKHLHGHMVRFESIHDQQVYCPTVESTLFELRYYQSKLRDELAGVDEQIATIEASISDQEEK
jgi:hypothetical protein